MNKKIVLNFVCMVFLMYNMSVQAMHGRIVRVVQIVTGGALIGTGVKRSYAGNENLKKPVDGRPMPDDSQNFIRQRMIDLGLTQESADLELLFNTNSENSWRAVADKAIVCNKEDIISLELCLQGKARSEELLVSLNNRRDSLQKNYQESQRTISQFKGHKLLEIYKKESKRILFLIKEVDDTLEEINQTHTFFAQELAQRLFVITHEIKHYINQDCKKTVYAYTVIPVAIETTFGTLRYGYNKLFKGKALTRLATPLLRCCLSGLSVCPRVLLSWGCLSAYLYDVERSADQFAYANAQSRLELEQGYAYWVHEEKQVEKMVIQECQKKYENNEPFDQLIFVDPEVRKQAVKDFCRRNDLIHPHPADRADMAQAYLIKWDQEHKE